MAAPLLRSGYNRNGATDSETSQAMPGDELVKDPKLTYTRAVTIEATPAEVWPWLVQIGQGRGGLYSFDALENLVGCDIHSTNAIRPEHQVLEVGDIVRSGAKDSNPCWAVTDLEPEKHLVLVGAGTPAQVEIPAVVDVVPAKGYAASTWQWLLIPDDDRTRLIVRQRLTYSPGQNAMWRIVEPINYVMEHEMLRGIKQRAEAGRSAPTYDVVDETIVDASPKTVFDALADEMDGKTSWWLPHRSMTLVTGRSAREVGARVESIIHGKWDTRFTTETIDVTDGESLKVRYVDGAFRGEGQWRFEPLDGRTRLSYRWRTSPSGPLRILAPLLPVRRSHSTVTKAGFHNLQSHVQPAAAEQQVDGSLPVTIAARSQIGGTVPGLAVVVVSPEQTLLSEGYGLADLSSGLAMEPATVCNWFSMTKLVTATAAMQLAERGELDLDAPVDHYYQPFSMTRPRTRGRSVTVRHLLSHSSGLANPIPLRWVHLATEPGPERATFVQSVLERHRRLRFEPGTRAAYTNLGYLVLGEVIEHAAGVSFEDYVQGNVLEPLGMRHTGFTADPTRSWATPYQKRRTLLNAVMPLLLPRKLLGPAEGGFRSLNQFYLNGAAYGGLIGPAAEAGRFLQAHLREGELDGNRILSVDSTKAMRTMIAQGRGLQVGLGWCQRGKNPTGQFVEHLGGGAGYWNCMRLYPRRHVGVIVMGNATAYDHDTIAAAANRIGSDRPGESCSCVI